MFHFSLLFVLLLVEMTSLVSSVSLKSVGGVFCEANNIGRKRNQCGNQVCGWKDWYKKHYENENEPVERVVVR